MRKTKKTVRNTKLSLWILGICAGILIACGMIHRSSDKEDIQKGIANQIIRFHVIANSDTEVDQGVKMLVKNKVVGYLRKKLEIAKTKENAEKIITEEIPNIQKIAKKTVEEEGYHYDCSVRLGQRMFPVKMYGDLIFPAGQYEALQVILGNAQGRNWWCVMFPTLCIVDGTYSYVPDSSKELLENVLNKKEYDAISENRKESDKIQIEYKFKIVELWQKLKGTLHK